MKNRYRRILLFLLSCVFCLAMTAGCGKSPAAQTGAAAETTIAAAEAQPAEAQAAEAQAAETQTAEAQAPAASGISESDTPTEKDELAEYIHVYGHLPSNFITKQEAKDLGWVSQEGNLWDVAPGCSIGGDRFVNYEGLLPEAPGRNYTECDVGYEGGRRNARRIVFSNDGLIYYTEDHYESFELLYGEE